VHHLIYAPDFDTADRLSASLARIGNIASDGRPILGLDSRHLLEITLQSGPDAYLIPAHIWTPWFAALGSQSGFDSIVDCYGDLSDHIFAVETGLSSDPAMNWRLSQLDRYRLVSNSDAHSPPKLGREATMFDCAQDYYAIKGALETGRGYVGTVEFFPEEGKYHHDGHRKCNVRQTPRETLANGGKCSVCGAATTVGVLSRVETLADRSEAEAGAGRPATAGEVASFVPLPEVLSELVSSGPTSKTVERNYDRLVSTLGAELSILGDVPIEDIERQSSSLLAEAITRLRAGHVIREAGYDGEYGVIRLFEASELKRLTTSGLLFGSGGSTTAPAKVKAKVAALPDPAPTRPGHEAPPPKADASVPPYVTPAIQSHSMLDLFARDVSAESAPEPAAPPASSILARLDQDQRAAASAVDGPLIIVAGPGSGKTRTLTHRLAHLVAERDVPASACLAITFTRRAAAEMRERLAVLLPAESAAVPIHTFHSLGLTILREHPDAAGLDSEFRIASESERTALLAETLGVTATKAASLLRAISKAKRTLAEATPTVAPHGASEPTPTSAAVTRSTPDIVDALAAYRQAMASRQWVDFDDLVGLALHALSTHADVAASYRDRFHYVSVDEFQDVDEQQYRLLSLLAPPNAPRDPRGGVGVDQHCTTANLCVIGDPNQAIYGFRGADAACFERFRQDYPAAAIVQLSRNYRSTGTIVAASSQVIAADAAQDCPIADIIRDMHERITVHVTPTDRAEADLIVQTIERLMGGHSLLSIDSGRATGMPASALGFSDFAVLYRTDAQSAVLCDAFARSGFPFKKHSHDVLSEQPAVRALLDEWQRDESDSTPLDAQLRSAAARVIAAQAANANNRLSNSQMPQPNNSPPNASSDGLTRPKTAAAAAASDAAGDIVAAPGFDTATIELAMQRLLQLADACSYDVARFIDALALATDADFWDPRADRISLLTLHAAKGLEFPVVFIAGLEDGILPLYWNELDEQTAAEERRLFYVGMTRAKDRLCISRAVQRLWRGRVQQLSISPFLNDIESELVKHQRVEPPKAKAANRQLRLL
jgi:uncharacterized protein (TIGR00375 family)